MDFNKYWRELQRRNVIKSAVAYLVAAWLITQVLSIVLPAFNAPDYFLKWALVILGVGFPFWIIFSWVYEFTPDGIKKTDDVDPEVSISAQTGTRLNKIIITTLSVAVVLLLIDRFTRESAQVVNYGDNSIAVMAFTDMSPKRDHEYFSDGISEELLNLLNKIPKLKVISRTSSFSFKGKTATATEIGDELNVSHILEGSIRKAGNTVRVTAKLIQTSDGSQLWSRTYDRDLDSIFRIQDEIAREVSKELKLSLLGESDQTPVVDLKAYNLYLQANHLFKQNTKSSIIEAKSRLDESLGIDSTFAASWGLLARIYNTGTYNFSIWDSNTGIKLGLEAVNRSIELDPDIAQFYATKSSLLELNWEFEESAANLNKALELNPNNAVIIGTAALNTFGDLEKSLELIKKAIELDPLVYGNYFNLGFTYLRLNRLEEAEKAFDTFEVYYPGWQIYHYMKAMIKLGQGLPEEALDEIEKETHEFFHIYGKNFVYFQLGDKAKADSLLVEFLEKYEVSDPANVADMYAFRGEYDKSFEYLEKALSIKDPVLIEILTYRSFEPMKSDPRWASLIERMNLPTDHGY